MAPLHRCWALIAVALSLIVAAPATAQGCAGAVAVCGDAGSGSLALIAEGHPATVLIDADADPAIGHAARSFATDLGRVGGTEAPLAHDPAAVQGPVVVIGELGRSALIDDLRRRGLIDPADLAGQWEAHRQVVIDNPYPHVPRALVIVGSDRRGAVFGTYDLSGRIGVSPWHWFADVPVERRASVYLTPGSRRDQPAVKYRGFFINDEAPAFSEWTREKFGGANSLAYAHVFELLLRLKGNYLWPAMWAPRAFNDDDPRNMVLADEMGVVMGTSHHEPLTRAQDEWHRNTEDGITGGAWNYETNAENLREFWRGGVERMMSKGDGQGYEALLTVGMRGDGDEAMSEGTAIPLLERIVADQRAIIAEVTGKPASETPQLWALYKEVQDYHDAGMQVPDDVTLLFADDNWGQIRRLPAIDAAPRAGGYGVYYHFDYVGAPRNYKWLDTVQIEKTWQQMDLAWQRGARTIWIVNVGDIKPEEFPLSFFMAHAWNPEAMDLAALERFPAEWAHAQFGREQAQAIGAILTRYGQLAARRKPELLDATSYALGEGAGPLLDGGEFGAIVAEWDALEHDMRAVATEIPSPQRSAWFELVEHKVRAMANLHRLYYAVAWNRRLATLDDPRANTFADQAEAAYREDQALTDAYHALQGGKWAHMMDQTHIGYASWQQPDVQVMPEVTRVRSRASSAPIAFAPARAADPLVVEAPAFDRAVSGQGLTWRIIPHLGRSDGAVAVFPQGRDSTPADDTAHLEYRVDLPRGGDLAVELQLVPTLDIEGRSALALGISLDDGPVEVVVDRLNPAPTETTTQDQRDWNAAVSDNVSAVTAEFPGVSAGSHVLRVWHVDANVVLQRLVLDVTP
jgi:hypothetical protein